MTLVNDESLKQGIIEQSTHELVKTYQKWPIDIGSAKQFCFKKEFAGDKIILTRKINVSSESQLNSEIYNTIHIGIADFDIEIKNNEVILNRRKPSTMFENNESTNPDATVMFDEQVYDVKKMPRDIIVWSDDPEFMGLNNLSIDSDDETDQQTADQSLTAENFDTVSLN